MSSPSLMARLIEAAGKTSRATVLDQSDFFTKDVLAQTDVPLINIMMGGTLDGGITPGSTMLVGDSRTFKTNYCLLHVASYLRRYPDAVCLFIDSEFGATKYFDSFGIDKSRVIHVPIENIEELKTQAVSMLEQINPKDRVIVLFDSMSQIASKKEKQDALDGKGTADMTRAAQLNSFWRMITPMLALRHIPMYTINSYYDDMSNSYAEPIIKGGKQCFLSADRIFIVTRAQVKDKKDEKILAGWTFNYKVLKSRDVKEKAVFPITVLFSGGIQRYTGMFDLAKLGGFIAMPSNGWYLRTDKIGGGFVADTTKVQRPAVENDDAFWAPILKSEAFKEFIRNRFSLESGAMMEDVDSETGEIVDAFKAVLTT